MTAPAATVSQAQLDRGHQITAKLRDLRDEIEAWASEVTAASPLLLETQRISSNVLTQLEGAQADLGSMTLVMAQAGGDVKLSAHDV